MSFQLKNKTKIASDDSICQKCLKSGHFTYECKNQQAYYYRPSKTAMIR